VTTVINIVAMRKQKY